MLELRLIKAEDVAEIQKWPDYDDAFAQMSYALRAHGWLDEFMDRPRTRIYVADTNGPVTGFSLLSTTREREAEFRIAIHPHCTGKGLGRRLALATLEAGFQQLDLNRIFLIVRKNNQNAAKLYKRIGFVMTGESVHIIRGEAVDFVDMEITRAQFNQNEEDA